MLLKCHYCVHRLQGTGETKCCEADDQLWGRFEQVSRALSRYLIPCEKLDPNGAPRPTGGAGAAQVVLNGCFRFSDLSCPYADKQIEIFR